MESIIGRCLCGEVKFECSNTFKQFYFCHCTQCQKMTGSAHVSNLFTSPDNIKWISGEESIKRYDVPGRVISSAFCSHCGSPTPYVSLSGNSLIVPAGILNASPNIGPQCNIFWEERASWYDQGVKSKHCDGFPD